ncbi:MAG TPA: hypothetical protein H9667_10775 [Firmicutes bacterium]|nr:hypothetical protein [Bacillota bacterium]
MTKKKSKMIIALMLTGALILPSQASADWDDDYWDDDNFWNDDSLWIDDNFWNDDSLWTDDSFWNDDNLWTDDYWGNNPSINSNNNTQNNTTTGTTTDDYWNDDSFWNDDSLWTDDYWKDDNHSVNSNDNNTQTGNTTTDIVTETPVVGVTISGQKIYQTLRNQNGWRKLSYKEGEYQPNRISSEIISYDLKNKRGNTYLEIEIDNQYNRYINYYGKSSLSKLLTAATDSTTSKQILTIADTAIRTGTHSQLRKKLSIGNYTVYVYVERSGKGNEVKIYLGNQNFSLYR